MDRLKNAGDKRLEWILIHLQSETLITGLTVRTVVYWSRVGYISGVDVGTAMGGRGCPSCIDNANGSETRANINGKGCSKNTGSGL